MSDTAASSDVTRVGPRRRVEQLARVAGRQQVQRQRARALGGDQPDEPVAAGDESRHAARRGGQQRAHLLLVPRVVQHHKHSLAREHAAVEPGLPRVPRESSLRGYRRPRGSRAARRPARSRRPRGRPPEAGEELAIGKPGGRPSAQCTASAVLPTPAVPDSTEIAAPPGPPSGLPGRRQECVQAGQLIRPAKGGPGGSCAGTGTGAAPRPVLAGSRSRRATGPA